MSIESLVFARQSQHLQDFANHLAQQPDVFEFDSDVERTIPDQLDAFRDRLLLRLVEYFDENSGYLFGGRQAAGELGLFDSAVTDTAAALNGVVRATRLRMPNAAPESRLMIARNSYPVLVRYALDSELAEDEYLLRNYNWFIDPEDLEFVNGDKPRFGLRPEARRKDLKMKCPAFTGRNLGLSRLPVYLWNGEINIYNALGEFGETAGFIGAFDAAEADEH